ncbi:5-oxoprolinase subunit PxpB [Liquorilactobacillus mali]|uniref:Carboxyltransferase domain-containing protein n=1 Tax=Liquorilactobacillus mali TaxID=1618 RepID=A0A0R2FGQ8_9LACO|nr:5-oxoprolinase subunit PxpB [Liquorilactobacillus mali]KRN27807.1 hypothetical protein IV36_GL000700 [Liquorilactobacillus mali]
MIEYDCVPVGEQTILIHFEEKIDITENLIIHKLTKIISNKIPYITAVTPAYCSIMINFDVFKITFREIVEQLKTVINNFDFSQEDARAKIIEVPVCYDREFAIDIEEIASFAHMSIANLIELHSKVNYFIYMLGFMPYYPYLGTTPDRIGMPRLESPRAKVPAGSVALAGKQAGIYPVESPGGWRIIGRTPIELYNPRNPRTRYEAGDYLHFYPISKTDFYRIKDLDIKGGFKMNEHMESI